jgi:integrase/recombinase XerD
VVIHPSTRDALSRYLRRRAHCFAERADKHVFLTTQGTALREGSAVHTFRRLTHKIGLCGSHTKRNPRLTDFRHCFAVKSLVRFYRSGKDPQRWLPVLSTHLGHAWTKETYWYIEQHPALMQEAMKPRSLLLSARRRFLMVVFYFRLLLCAPSWPRLVN